MLISELTQQELDNIIAERDQCKELAETRLQHIKTITGGVIGLLINFGVANDDGTIPERINLTRVGKRVMPIFVAKINPMSNSESTFEKLIEPLTPVYPVYELYKNLFSLQLQEQ